MGKEKHTLKNVYKDISKVVVIYHSLSGHSGIDLKYDPHNDYDQYETMEEAIKSIDGESFSNGNHGDAIAIYKLVGIARGELKAKWIMRPVKEVN